MHLLLPALPTKPAALLAVAGIVLVACAFIIERAPAGSKWRRLAFAFITLTGVTLCCLGAWLAYRNG